MNQPRYEDWIMQGDDEEICLNRPPWLSLLVIAIIIGIVLCLTSKTKAGEPLFKPTGIYAIVESKPEIFSEIPAASTAAPIPAPQTAKELDAEIAKLVKQRDALKPKQSETAASKQAVAMKSTAGLHSHRCSACGAEWWHGSESFGNANAHKCPKCGKIEYTVHRQGSSAVSRPVVELPSVKKEWPLKSPQLTESGEQQSPTLRDEYVIPTKKFAAAPKAAVRVVASSGCPGGVCPWTRRARRCR